MKNPFIYFAAFCLVFSSCSKELDDVPQPFNDNPYDNDYTGPKVIKIVEVATSHASSTTRNEFYYTISHSNNEGVKLYKNGILINTHHNHTTHTVYISDNSTFTGQTSTYMLVLFSGSGTAESEPVTFTTQ